MWHQWLLTLFFTIWLSYMVTEKSMEINVVLKKRCSLHILLRVLGIKKVYFMVLISIFYVAVQQCDMFYSYFHFLGPLYHLNCEFSWSSTPLNYLSYILILFLAHHYSGFIYRKWSQQMAIKQSFSEVLDYIKAD